MQSNDDDGAYYTGINAALAEAHGLSEFQCDYVGQTPLAKSYGTFPTYHVRWR